jgi:hypothetical protein
MGFRAYVGVRVLAVVLFGVMMAMLAVPASATPMTILYDNGAVNGTINSWDITSGWGDAVADSFTLSGDSTLMEVKFGEWVGQDYTPISVDWAIVSTLPNSWILGTGPLLPGATAASLTNTKLAGLSPFDLDGTYYDIYSENFILPNVSLASGTYYLVLQNARTSEGPTYSVGADWDINNGPSTAYTNWGGNMNDNLFVYDPTTDVEGTGSNSFQILGTTSPTPEPGTLTLLGSGLIGLGMLRKRRQRK